MTDYKDIFGVEANPDADRRQDVKRQIGELKRQIAALYRSIGEDAEAEKIYPTDNTADYDSAGQVL